MKRLKFLLSFFVLLVFALGFSSSLDEDVTDEFKSEKCGTYKVTDANNDVFTIVIKKDMTATVEVNGNIFYTTWSKSYDLVHFLFAREDYWNHNAQFAFPEDPTGGTFSPENNYYIADDGFLYSTYRALERHEPYRRLKIIKINNSQ